MRFKSGAVRNLYGKRIVYGVVPVSFEAKSTQRDLKLGQLSGNQREKVSSCSPYHTSYSRLIFPWGGIECERRATIHREAHNKSAAQKLIRHMKFLADPILEGAIQSITDTVNIRKRTML